jgi:hypothetical protein
VSQTFTLRWSSAAPVTDAPDAPATSSSSATVELDRESRTIRRIRLRARGQCASDAAEGYSPVELVLALGPIALDDAGNFSGTTGIDSNGDAVTRDPATNSGDISFRGQVTGNTVTLQFDAGFRLSAYSGACIAAARVEVTAD